MAGTTRDIIPIVIIPVLALAFWLGMIFYVNAHPLWRTQVPEEPGSTQALPGSVPAQRLSSRGPVVPGQRLGSAEDERTPEQVRSSETRRE